MSATWPLATAGARAHRGALSVTGLVLAAAGAVLSVVGVLMESGVREKAGLLTTLASSYAGTALVVVVLVVAATVTLAVRGRRREFALLRTIGATRGQVRSQISQEVLLVAAIAVPPGAALGLVGAGRLRPLLHEAGFLDGTLVVSPLPVLGAIALLLPTALMAGRLAARETVRTAPTEAVRQSAAESAHLGPVRIWSAVLTALAGLSTAFTPLFVPGTIGSAVSATSGFLLIGAAALAGPLLVGWAFGRTERLGGRRARPETRLALANLRGFSRRLTTVVVPLALALGVGTIQTSTDRAIATAAAEQLQASITGDLIVTGAADPSRLAALPGVSRVVPLGSASVDLRTDSDNGLPDSLTWEVTPIRTVPADVPATAFDPEVRSGSLTALADPGTVAISSDTAFELGTGRGESVSLRAGGVEHRLTVVAVYDRGLGVGPLLATPATVSALGASTSATSAVVEAGDPQGTAGRIRDLGGVAQTPAGYAASAANADVAAQHLSSVLLLLLLVFVGLGAANVLVLTTAGRRDELALLHRTGTTPRQLLRMTVAESLLTGVLAWVTGTLAVVPGVLAVSLGLLGWAPPAIDLAAYGVLSAAVLIIAVGSSSLVAVRTIRRVTGRPGRAA